MTAENTTPVPTEMALIYEQVMQLVCYIYVFLLSRSNWSLNLGSVNLGCYWNPGLHGDSACGIQGL